MGCMIFERLLNISPILIALILIKSDPVMCPHEKEVLVSPVRDIQYQIENVRFISCPGNSKPQTVGRMMGLTSAALDPRSWLTRSGLFSIMCTDRSKPSEGESIRT